MPRAAPYGGVVMLREVMVAANRVRGFWLTDLGQRVEEWVPVGLYDVGGPADVDGVPTVALVGNNGWAWHVPAAVAAKLTGRVVA